MSELDQLLQTASEQITATDNLKLLDEIRVHYLGKKGVVTEQLKTLGKLPAAERKSAGQRINQVKQAIQALLEARGKTLQAEAIAAKLASEAIDVTLPGRRSSRGSLHPVSITLQRIQNIFANYGFSVADGPEIEDDFHNFEALNIPEHHPVSYTHLTLPTTPYV